MIRVLLIAAVKAYRFTLSPWVGNSCRFTPTCSMYSIESLERHGAVAGSYLTVHRLVRCNPWCEGGHDPVSLEKPRLLTHLVTPFSKKKSS